MNRIKIFALVLMMALVGVANAQFSQARPKYEYMLKAEIGYLPFVSNLGVAGDYGYYLEDLQHMLNVNVMNGININQDFFVGLGLGYANVFVPSQLSDDLMAGWHSAMAFVDFDYRPLDRAWSPMVYAKGGAHYLMNDGPYGNTLTPMAELGLGLNWYYDYRLVNMERNYRSLYFTIGFAFMQQTTFIPLRMGLRF